MAGGARASSSSARREVAFRRATEADAYELARRMFLSGERVDMQALATELGISRATLHRWVQTREALLDRVLGDLADEYFTRARRAATGAPDDVIVAVAEGVARATIASGAISGFVRREPELALRLMLRDDASVRRVLVGRLRGVLQDVLPDEAEGLEGFAAATVQLGLLLVWPTLVAGDEPSGERVAEICRALLAGARAGELSGGR
ncbi:hypothetical protein LRS13_10600 [Svornostia abyssi]|uniref:QsdR TetR regulatory C-terminal domain-containing protein n=1 Tax=Svornostia abyssi TaxID=2898438 RepID=A0ABY5PML9_9ACTN|nr:hypothetical protein LRS13_10600 [Parviterribacteraceae bacterium J379]